MYHKNTIFGILSKGNYSAALCGVACAALAFSHSTSVHAQAVSQLEPLVAVSSSAGAKDFTLAAQAALSDSQPLHLVFHLKGADIQTIQAFVDSQQDPTSSNYHHWLTPEEFGEKFGASDSDIQAVAGYLQSRGLAISKISANRMFIFADTDVSHANAVFGIHMLNYNRQARLVSEADSQTFYSPDSVPTLPMSIAQRLNGVVGLSDYNRRTPQIVRSSRQPNPVFAPALSASPSTVTAYTSPLVPNDLSNVYDIVGLHTAGAEGTGMKIAIFSPTTRIASDVTTFATQFNLGAIDVQDIQVDGGATAPYGPDEAALDGEVIVGQAPRADIRYYDCPNTDSGSIAAYDQMGDDGVQVVSSSWAAYEDTYAELNDTSYEDSYATTVASLASEGISVFNAAGDTGAFDEGGSEISVLFEAADPNVTAVGGTGLPNNNNGYWNSEVAWSYSADTGGGGGGLSTFFPRPSWQNGPGVTNSYSNGMRQLPDISALADPNNPGYYIIFEGDASIFGGTSASTPLWASATLLMDELVGTTLGNINPSLYTIGTNLNPPTGLFSYHDITSGNDGVYSCTQYWDYVTGWGSVDFLKLYDDMTQLPDFTPTTPTGVGPGGTWTSPIMIHTTTTSVAEPAQFNTATVYRFAASVGDSGAADGVATTNEIIIDGVAHVFAFNQIQKNTYLATLGAYFTSLSAGSHTISLVANIGNASESSRTNNTFVRTITVVSTNPPPLTYTLNAGSVVGGFNVTGTVTFSSSSTTARVVTLSSSNTSLATVPVSVTVPANSKTASFTIVTGPVTAATNLALTATNSTNSVSAFLLLTVPSIATATLTSVSPTSITAGAPAITITVTGTGFTSASYVEFNSTRLVTTYVSSTTLKAVIPTSLLSAVTIASISEVTPGFQPTNSIAFDVVPAVLGVVSATAVRDSNSNIFLQVTLQDISTSRVANVVVNVGTLNGVSTVTSLPIALGSFAANGSNTVTLEYPSSAAAHNVTVNFTVQGVYTGGSYAIGTSVHVP